MTLVSRTQGWINVDADNPQNRRSYNRKVQQQRLNVMERTNQSKGDTMQQFQNKSPLANVRQEHKRVFLVDIKQPNKSVFNIGDMRHNVPFKVDYSRGQD